jgi:hypothetical protein
MAKGLPTFCCVTRPKRRAPLVSKRIVTDRLVGGGIESLLRVDQLIAGHHRATLHRDAAAALQRQDLGARPRPAALRARLVRRHQLEVEPCRLSEQRFQPFRILETRNLDQDPVRALADDGGLLGAFGVDAVEDHFARRIHRLVERFLEPGLGRRHDHAAGVDHADVPGPLPAHADRLRLVARDLHRRIHLRRIADHEAEPPVGDRRIADLDPRRSTPRFGADRLLHQLEPLLGDVGRVRFHQQVAAAGKVEAEIDAGARQEAGPARHLGFRKEARDRERDADQAQQRDAPDLPAREIEHGSVVRRFGAVGPDFRQR